VRDAANEWFGGGARPFTRVYTARAGAWIALGVDGGRACVAVHPASERARLVDAARPLIAADRQITEILEDPT
jgi:hypothetical protein